MSSNATAIVPYGTVTLDGIQYIERPQIFTTECTITQGYQVFTNQRLTLPGNANFLLKGLTRDITIPPGAGPFFSPPAGSTLPISVAPRDAAGSQDRRFRFRITNAEGSVWFFTGGLGVFNDRVIDVLCFGNGQFPYPLIPPVPMSANSTLIYEVEDMGFGVGESMDPDYYPYTIHFGFQGSLLIPASEATGQSVVYAVVDNAS